MSSSRKILFQIPSILNVSFVTSKHWKKAVCNPMQGDAGVGIQLLHLKPGVLKFSFFALMTSHNTNRMVQWQ